MRLLPTVKCSFRSLLSFLLKTDLCPLEKRRNLDFLVLLCILVFLLPTKHKYRVESLLSLPPQPSHFFPIFLSKLDSQRTEVPSWVWSQLDYKRGHSLSTPKDPFIAMILRRGQVHAFFCLTPDTTKPMNLHHFAT